MTNSASSTTHPDQLTRFRYTAVEEAPVPIDSAVKLRQLPSRTQAVSTFTWSLKEANVRAHLEALVAEIQADPEWQPVITENGEPEWCAAGYNAPFTIPFLRTNEVMVTIRRRNTSQATEASAEASHVRERARQ